MPRQQSANTRVTAILSACLLSWAATVGCAQTAPSGPNGAPAAEAASTFGESAPLISATDLLERQHDSQRPTVVLDVRTPEEFAAGHVPGAINIPHDQLATRVAELADARDKEIVAYCRSGRRAALALTTLHDAGFAQLSHLDGDFLAWQAANRPIEVPPASRPAEPAGQH